jgi:AbrB family looped-hinge helix DNA binding protein
MNVHKSIKVRVASNGRLVLPKEARVALGIEGEGLVNISIEGEEVRLKSRRAGIAHAQELYRKHIANGTSSDEFVQQRRREAAWDNANGR